MLEKIKHFFEHYKDTEPKKWVKVQGFKDSNVAYDKYRESIIRYKRHGCQNSHADFF